ncbi:MAG TPA: hypothetical protein VL995_13695 [Cellvibrio sp.]|nr:hypothetical protein [Cellvibrio sp.]
MSTIKTFYEGIFPGSMTALLRNQPSQFAIAAFEAEKIEIDFNAYRSLIPKRDDLKLFQISTRSHRAGS